ncbi:hypothetical protein EOD40_04765 [Flavobacterium sufflavum]|uniref:Uncharacterized protein n=1 Tax=Flavobacterium sufflavum TaxID=1921138 RepID=A0A437L0T5_9FLAO|nr:hypothetical protein [Flavobacterium sufflavum]RVT78550.1 hypothetical protein EOD40_04765 [Flavobacterium sufflavum]
MSSTGNTPDYIRHTYNVTSELKSYTIYQLAEVARNKNLLTDILRIEKFQGKSNASNIKDYLRLRTTNNWSTCEQITGLKNTNKPQVFYGDRRDKETSKRTLLIFLFSEDKQTLFIDIYRGFYPNHNGILQNIINTY